MAYQGVYEDGLVTQSLQRQFGNVGSIGKLTAIGKVVLSITPTAVGSATYAEQTFAIPGVQVGDMIDVYTPFFQAGLSIQQARCATVGVVSVAFGNASGASITPTAGSYSFIINR